MKKFIFIFLILVLIVPVVAGARSGCCSHHGGVCGCGCCDGSGLSATCAPYYPSCNSDTSSSSDSGNNNWISWLIGIGAIGVVLYFIGKNKKQ